MDDEQTLFEARLSEHRSLDARGGWIVAGMLGGLGLVAAIGFAAIGAWPVAGFAGVEVLLAVALLLAHRRRVRTEAVRLTPSALTIEQGGRGGRGRLVRLRPDWLRVRVVERAGTAPLVLLTERGAGVEVGNVLSEPERRAFAGALDHALHRMRSPWWDAETKDGPRSAELEPLRRPTGAGSTDPD